MMQNFTPRNSPSLTPPGGMRGVDEALIDGGGAGGDDIEGVGDGDVVRGWGAGDSVLGVVESAVFQNPCVQSLSNCSTVRDCAETFRCYCASQWGTSKTYWGMLLQEKGRLEKSRMPHELQVLQYKEHERGGGFEKIKKAILSLRHKGNIMYT